MEPAAVSVIIPTYNRAHLLGRAVNSALAATAPGDEIIVVDDGSTDHAEEVTCRYGNRIRYVRMPHAGAGVARNRGIHEARCPLIAFLDSDDEWMPDILLLQRPLMLARPDVVCSFSNFTYRHADGRVLHRALDYWLRDRRVGFLGRPPPWDEILGPGVPFSSLAQLPAGREDFGVYIGNLYPSEMEAACVFTGTVLVRREAAGDRLRFAEDLPTFEDWECFGRLAGAGPVAYLDCETAYQWDHSGPRLAKADDFRAVTARLTMLERVWGADTEFLARHGDRFRRVVANQHLLKARWLLREGLRREARAELRSAGGGPMSYRLLATLPGPLVRNLLAFRRVIRQTAGHA